MPLNPTTAKLATPSLKELATAPTAIVFPTSSGTQLSDYRGDRVQAVAEPFRLASAGAASVVEREVLYPRGELDGELDDGAPDLVLGEPHVKVAAKRDALHRLTHPTIAS